MGVEIATHLASWTFSFYCPKDSFGVDYLEDPEVTE